MKNTYQQEILKAQLEMKEKTLYTVSQEIHDNIGQMLSLAKLNLNTLTFDNFSTAKQKITTTKDLIGKAIQDLRDLSKTLNSDYVSRKNLSDSLQFELNFIGKTGLYETELQVFGKEQPFDPEQQLIIFRIAQEILNNIIKHAQAQHIFIKLEYLTDKMILSISDDGNGFDISTLYDTHSQNKGAGIYNMYHRAKLIGAELAIDSSLGKGTFIQLSVPFQS